jgi:FkbM family methyltransferase
VIRRLKAIVRGAARRVAMAPFAFLSPHARAQALEILSDRMIAETPVGGRMLRFFAPTPLLRERAASVLTKEPDMIRWIDGMRSDSVFWDIGSNVGVFSLYAAVRVNCIVISFEPAASNFFVLTRNIQLNRLSDQVTAYCLALSGKTELGALNLASPAMGGATNQFGRVGESSRYWTDNGERAAHGTLGFTIDDFIERFSPPFPTHIKIDVDGLELPILQGATKTLADSRVRAVMAEVSLTRSDEREQTMSLFKRAGLEFVGRGDTQGAAIENAANHLFVRSE